MKTFFGGKWYRVENRSIIKDWIKAVGIGLCLLAIGYFGRALL